MKTIKVYTKSAMSFDEDAIAINAKLNDVARMCGIGHELKAIYDNKFNGCGKQFNRWVRMNIDKDIKSVIRYMTLADNEELLCSLGIIRLSEAYEMLGIDGNISDEIHTIVGESNSYVH